MRRLAPLSVVVVLVAAVSRRPSNVDAISAVRLAYRRLMPLPPPEEGDARAEELLRRYPFIDGHADVPMQLRMQYDGDVSRLGLDLPPKARGTYTNGAHVDIPKLRQGRVGMQVWAAWVPPEATELDVVAVGITQVELTLQAVEAHAAHLTLVTTSGEVEAAFAAGRVGVLLGVEGGQALGNSLEVLRSLHRLGVRLLTLTHTKHLAWASSCQDWTPQLGGLSSFGISVVQEMNRLGMLVDLSHASHAVMLDALNASAAPLVWSHSNAFALCRNARNVPDHILDLISKFNGGIVMVTFPEQFVLCDDDGMKGHPVTLDHVVNHVHYLVERMGVDHVGIGSDYDGARFIPSDLEHVGRIPRLVSALLRSGRYTTAEMVKLLGGNFLRVMRAVERVASSWTAPAVAGAAVSLHTSPEGALLDGSSPCTYRWT